MNTRLPTRAILALCLAAATGAALAQGAGYTRAHTLLEDEPATGTRIEKQVASSPIPFDKSYDQLRWSQQLRLRSKYEAMPANCEPPYPERGMERLTRRIVDSPQTVGAQGTVIAIANVDALGMVQEVRFEQAPSEAVSRAVAVALMREEFKPALCGELAMPAEFGLKLRFTS